MIEIRYFLLPALLSRHQQSLTTWYIQCVVALLKLHWCECDVGVA